MRNKSETYLLPLLSEIVNFDKKFAKNIKCSYINFNDEKYKNCLGVMYEFSFKNPEYTHYENKLIQNELFIDLFDVGKDVLYIFKFPEEYMHEYECYKSGLYSKFGLDAKELILTYYGDLYKGNLSATSFLLKINQVLFKDKKLKRQLEKELGVQIDDDAELSSVPLMENETFDLSQIKKRNKILIDNNGDRNCLKDKNERENE